MASDSGKKRRTNAPTSRRSERLQVVVLVLLALGLLSMAYRVRTFPDAVATARAHDHEMQLVLQQQSPAAKAAMRGAAIVPANDTAESTAPVPIAIEPTAPLAPTAPLEPEVPIKSLPPLTPATKTLDELSALSLCERERDVALIDVIRASATTFCTARNSSDSTTRVTLIDVPGGIKATVLNGLILNFKSIKIHKPIADLAHDGAQHDPRFVFTHHVIHCRCRALYEYANNPSSSTNKPLGLWATAFARVDTQVDAPSTVCDPALPSYDATNTDNDVITIDERVILIARRDDHNPFFQVSAALNAWVVAHALDWDLATTRVVHLDAGFPSPIDALHAKLLAPTFGIVSGTDLLGKRVVFTNDVLLAPYEVSGPMMQHLNDIEPCRKSQLFHTFRNVALSTMGVLDAKTSLVPVETTEETDETDSSLAAALASSSVPVTVTVITRRAYSGRTVQRVWRNEADVLNRMRVDYAALNIRFQSVDFVALPLAEQMAIVVESDVVIGMHGAGMVNVLWTRPETLVVEIFPKERRRWGYRNLCQFVGCDWHEFRGGTDIGKSKDPNAKDKRIAYSEWHAFFDALVRAKYAQVQEQANDLDE